MAFAITIDTSALTFPLFLIPGQTPEFEDGALAPTLTLEAGTYSFQQASGYFGDFQFEVTPGGTLDYDAKFDAFLSGRGTDRLTVSGFTIDVDLTALSHGLLPMVAGVKDFLMPDQMHQLVLVPASFYGFHPGSGLVADFVFGVDLDGKVVIDPKYAGFADGVGTSTLTIRGFTIEVDLTALSHGLLPMIAGVKDFLMPDQIHQMVLIPANFYGFHPGSGLVADFAFGVDLNGKIVIDPKYAGFADGAGSDRLTIRGYVVQFDGRRLTHGLLPMVAIPSNDFLPKTTINSLTLIPCKFYGFQPGSGVVADMSFDLGVDGLIDYPANCDGFLQGRGSNLLTLLGYPVLVDATQADSDLVGLVDIGQNAQAPRFLLGVLLPAPGYRLQSTKGVFSQGFVLERSGAVTVDAAVAGRLVVSTVPRVEVIGATPI
jgi:hypothetical protein